MNNIARIQEKLIEKGLDAILITDEKNQRYATGFPFTDGSVLVSREKAWLFTDARYIEAAEAAAACCCSVQMFDKNVSQIDLIRAALKEAKVEKLGGEEEKLNYAGYAQFEKDLSMPLIAAQAVFSELRSLKTAEEVDSIIKAQRISEKALEAVLHIIKPGMTEREVAAELVYHMLKNGSEGNAFDPIVVTGSKTSLPHGVPGDKVICAGDFITMDFGSLYNGYCSDMTRTVAVGHATDEMKTVYDTVLKAQLAGIAASKAGVIGLTKTWAKEFARKGVPVRVNAIAPGYIMTDMMKTVPEDLLKKFAGLTMLGRLGQPEEIANAALFLASDESSYITGHVLSVNGGMRL